MREAAERLVIAVDQLLNFQRSDFTPRQFVDRYADADLRLIFLLHGSVAVSRELKRRLEDALYEVKALLSK